MTVDAVVVRALRENELGAAQGIMRLAFGSFVGLAEPTEFNVGVEHVAHRWHNDPAAAFAAELDGRLVGSNFATRWGSFGFFGPLSIAPQFWSRGYAHALMAPVMDCFARWDTALCGLFTFPHSARHIALYQRYGFRPRALTLVLERDLAAGGAASPWRALSTLDATTQAGARADIAALCDALHAGLDPRAELATIAACGLGDTLLVGADRVEAFAACHLGTGTEAGPATCYVKFAAARPGAAARRHFGSLLAACADFARSRGATRLVLGINAARTRAYEDALAAGFRVALTGIAMHRPNIAGFSRPDAFVIDDWR